MVYPIAEVRIVTRTQIYLSEDQKAALGLLVAGRASSVSDLVREAVDRLLEGELKDMDLGTRLAEVQSRLQARIGERSDADVAEAVKRAKAKRRDRVPA